MCQQPNSVLVICLFLLYFYFVLFRIIWRDPGLWQNIHQAKDRDSPWMGPQSFTYHHLYVVHRQYNKYECSTAEIAIKVNCNSWVIEHSLMALVSIIRQRSLLTISHVKANVAICYTEYNTKNTLIVNSISHITLTSEKKEIMSYHWRPMSAKFMLIFNINKNIVSCHL